jgi:hypothetical protein
LGAATTSGKLQYIGPPWLMRNVMHWMLLRKKPKNMTRYAAFCSVAKSAAKTIIGR